jgi:predicted phosphoribosyltransferase
MKAAGALLPIMQQGGMPDYIASEKQAQLETIRKRRAQYTPIRPPIYPEGRIVIGVDDGLATGSTMISASHSLRAKHPVKLICADRYFDQSTAIRG